MKKKIQIFYIHGAETFKNQKDYLRFLKTRKILLKTPDKEVAILVDDLYTNHQPAGTRVTLKIEI
jgi:hypothetical protein